MHCTDCPPNDSIANLDKLRSESDGDLSCIVTVGYRGAGTTAIACFMDESIGDIRFAIELRYHDSHIQL